MPDTPHHRALLHTIGAVASALDDNKAAASDRLRQAVDLLVPPESDGPTDLEFLIGKLSLAPSDVLVLKSAERLSPDAIVRITLYVQRTVGPEQRVLILDGGIDLAVLTRAEIDAMTTP